MILSSKLPWSSHVDIPHLLSTKQAIIQSEMLKDKVAVTFVQPSQNEHEFILRFVKYDFAYKY